MGGVTGSNPVECTTSGDSMTKVLTQSATVDSEAVDAFEYDHSKKSLKVTFISGSEYVFSKVPVDIFSRALRAKSQGRFFNKNIRDKFKFKKI